MSLLLNFAPKNKTLLTHTPFQNNLEEFGNILCCYEVLCVMVIRGRLKTGGFVIYLELNNITDVSVSTKLALSVRIHNGDIRKSSRYGYALKNPTLC